MSFKKILDKTNLIKINETISYNHQTGIFTWLTGYGPRKKGSIAGCMTTSGYLQIYIDGLQFAAHRLAWVIHYGEEPSGIVDHINGIKTDNRISNLRIATFSQNSMNSKLSSLNTSGCKGVSWKKETKKWVAVGKLNGKKVHLGYFKNLDDAKNAYCEFAMRHHGEFYRSK
ncbi:HNH endonuclease [Escherichia coli]|uniref:HNH endonuclease n=1 Tax=Escherichia coli TaxID=562 RepID=UPI001F06B8BC|nr:HNH endonuclease [Escherichia coli]MCH0685628.1 HNH endonuclease [Escherichia coli]MDZ8664470.1 HNH endonuclease [Escherichia coli]WRX87710.1 HNH endonuclease [Escherichia coli]